MVSPECIPALLLFESLDDNEVAYIDGTDKINKYTGYMQTFQWVGNFDEQHSNNTILALDAIPFKGSNEQFSLQNITRELNKAYLGFSFSPAQNKILTGKWGCGVFGGNVHLKFLLQWIAASECEKQMKFCTMGDSKLKDAEKLLKRFVGQRIGILMNKIVGYKEYNLKYDLFEYLNLN